MPKSDFVVALTQLAAERGLPQESVLSAIEDAIASTYQRDSAAAGQNVAVRLDPGSGDVSVNILKTVVDVVTDDRTEVAIDDARQIAPDAELGEVITTESMPHIPGRIAAQTAKQVVMQRLRDAERDIVYQQYEGKAGEVFLVTLQKIEPRAITVDLGRSEAFMPAHEQVPTERYRSNTKMRVLLKSVERSATRGLELIVSRADKLLLRRLFEMEVPEIFNGAVEIEAIAREAGSRSKVAVRAMQDGVDPVGSCVGLRGVRIQNIVNELNGEKIDVVEWHRDAPVFVANALSPAQVLRVELNLDDDTAMAVVPERQLSLAIGREGQNVRLAAHLTGWKVDIKSDVEYQVELEERARLAAEERMMAAERAQLAADEAYAAAQVDAVAAPDVLESPDEEAGDEQVQIAAEVAVAEDAAADVAEVSAIDEAAAEEARRAAEAAELAELEAAIAELEAQEAAAEIAADDDVADDSAADVDAVAPEIAADAVSVETERQVAADVGQAAEQPVALPTETQQAAAEMDRQAAAEAETTSLRDLPDDIWTVRRARARRPAPGGEDAPGQIRFAEDIAGLRGGVTASRGRRRRSDQQSQAPAANRGGGGRRRKAGGGGKRRR